MQHQLEKIFCEAFDIEVLEDSMSIETVEGWDSMAHVGLVMSLQKAFGVSISPMDAIELTDVGAIKHYLREHGVD